MHTRGEIALERRLAAILAADVVGYSRLTGRTRKARSNVLKRCAASFSIRKSPSIAAAFKTTGDGLLVEFASAVAAVRCALDMQEAMPERNAGIGPTTAWSFASASTSAT